MLCKEKNCGGTLHGTAVTVAELIEVRDGAGIVQVEEAEDCRGGTVGQMWRYVRKRWTLSLVCTAPTRFRLARYASDCGMKLTLVRRCFSIQLNAVAPANSAGENSSISLLDISIRR
jgi:hypothetical protein